MFLFSSVQDLACPEESSSSVRGLMKDCGYIVRAEGDLNILFLPLAIYQYAPIILGSFKNP